MNAEHHFLSPSLLDSISGKQQLVMGLLKMDRHRTSYKRVDKRRPPGGGEASRGFRIKCRRFTLIPMLIAGWVRRWREVMRSGGNRKSSPKEGRCQYSLKTPLRRSNTFYAEAIADCLEFINRTSAPP